MRTVVNYTMRIEIPCLPLKIGTFSQIWHNSPLEPVCEGNSSMPTQIQHKNRLTVQTLGCKLNYAETSELAKQFVLRGYEIGGLSANTNVFLLNTCSVTLNAERECRQIIRRVKRTAPDAFIAVTGCYAQLRPEEIAGIDGVDVVLGAKEKFQLFELQDSFAKSQTPKIYASEISEANDFDIASSAIDGERTRAFLKVQDGCDYSCSFCTIPLARGSSRSVGIDPILIEARKLCREGFFEIVLTGVNVGDYGRKTGTSFFELVQSIEADSEISARIRISSIEPNLLTDEIIRIVAASRKFCPHFHIPLQSGAPSILRRMQRRYTAEFYRSRIETIKQAIPSAGIGVDVIVGFPGESDDDFEQTFDFLHAIDISYLHVFTYSERPDTPAATIGCVVPPEIRKLRNHRLRILSEKKRRAFYASQTGRVATVLVEQPDMHCGEATDVLSGFTENYIRVRIPKGVKAENQLAEVLLGDATGDVMGGQILRILPQSYSRPARQMVSQRYDSLILPILQA
jgi:threonylcarbamoyladenosine tRNA methylthiotransferase MtaB